MNLSHLLANVVTHSDDSNRADPGRVADAPPLLVVQCWACSGQTPVISVKVGAACLCWSLVLHFALFTFERELQMNSFCSTNFVGDLFVDCAAAVQHLCDLQGYLRTRRDG